MIKKFKITTFLSIILTLLIADAPGKNLNNSNRPMIVPGVVVAKLKDNFQSIDIANSTVLPKHSILKLEQAFPQHHFSPILSRIVTVQFSKTVPPGEFALQLIQTGMFEYVEPRYMSYVADVIPNDTLVSRQFYLDQVNMFSAWEIQQGSPDIVIAIVDNGADYLHPDLIANIWTNQDEANGMPGVDDDGNGFVDDLFGWDFGDNDNDPIYGTDEVRTTVHGTHTAGVASAMTNNITGIAGIGWNCRIMPIKTSRDADARSIPFGYEGIVYAADNGAHVINNSWGRGGLYSQFEQDIINYATDKGSIVVAAAGNSRSNEQFFPAAYGNVIAVAAVNEADAKASYSTYGKFVDLSAPGGDGNLGILSTFPVSRGSYGDLNGTSFASPIVAGIMGLLINRFPEFDQFELTRQLVLASDPIDEKNPDYRGLLGNGRANAFQALTLDRNQLSEQAIKIDFFNAAIYDSIWGNGNFLLERNELIGVDVWYRNYAVSPGANFTISLATDDPDITIVRGQITLRQVPPDAIFKIEKQLVFKISPHAKPHVAKLALQYASYDNNVVGVDTITAVIGKSSVLLVDDDNGTRNVEDYYTTALDQLGVPYLRWDHVQLGAPPAQTLAQFPLVIWFCEWAFPSLSPEDRFALQAYLNQGGNLFLSGQDIGWDLADPTGFENNQYSESAAKFYQEALHSIYRSDISGSSKVIGAPGSLMQGLIFDIYQPKIPIHFQFPDWIEAAPGAQLILKYENGRGSSVFFQGDYSVINLGFGFEAIDAQFDEDPRIFSRARSELMRRVIDRLGPIRHQAIADRDQPIDTLRFEAAISPLITDLSSLLLFWKTETMVDYSMIAMQHIGENRFQQTINLHDYVGQVHYFFKLVTPFFEIEHPITAPQTPSFIRIGIDRVPPEIYHIPLADIFIQNTGRLVQAFVSDNIAVNQESVWLYYASTAMTDSIKMESLADNWYQAPIPPIASSGDSIHYFFSATDIAANPNREESQRYSYRTGIETFEFGLESWIADSAGWEIDDQDFHTGQFCISTFPGKAYPNDQNVSIRAKAGLRQRDLQDAMLKLWTRYELEESKDLGFIEISMDHGENWFQLDEPVTGIQESWVQKSYDLGAFYNESSDTLLLRFRLQTDAEQAQSLQGWFIDDIMIQPRQIVRVTDQESSARPGSPTLANFYTTPNPFNEITRIHFEINFPGDVDLEILNILGQTVFTRSMGILTSGRHSLIWNGRDAHGARCSSGLYFCRLSMKAAEPKSSMHRLAKTIKMIYLQ